MADDKKSKTGPETTPNMSTAPPVAGAATRGLSMPTTPPAPTVSQEEADINAAIGRVSTPPAPTVSQEERAEATAPSPDIEAGFEEAEAEAREEAPATAPSEPETAPQNTPYIVKGRDTPWSIAEDHLKEQGIRNPSAKQIQNAEDHIAEANNLDEASIHLIDPGQKLFIPNTLGKDHENTLDWNKADKHAKELGRIGANKYAQKHDIERSGVNAAKGSGVNVAKEGTLRQEFSRNNHIVNDAKHTVKAGDTLDRVFQNNGFADPGNRAIAIEKYAQSKNMNPDKLKIGQELENLPHKEAAEQTVALQLETPSMGGAA